MAYHESKIPLYLSKETLDILCRAHDATMAHAGQLTMDEFLKLAAEEIVLQLEVEKIPAQAEGEVPHGA